MNLSIYTVLLKDVICGDLRYGNNYYDYQEGTLIFFAPGQVYSLENEEEVSESKGYALVFHPDLLRGTSLGRRIHDCRCSDVRQGARIRRSVPNRVGPAMWG